MQHRDGSFLEYHPKGNVVHKIVGTTFEITVKDRNVLVSGDCNITIHGNAHLQIDGNAFTHIKGDAEQIITGKSTHTCEGDTHVTTKVGQVVNVTADEINLNAVSAVNINADLNVRGDIIGRQTISAYGNVNAGMNVYGTLSLQTSGYLSVLKTAIISGLTTCLTDFITGSGISLNNHKHPETGSTTQAPIP